MPRFTFRRPRRLWPSAALVIFLVVTGLADCWAEERTTSGVTTGVPPPIVRQALVELAGVDDAKRETAVVVLMEQGDPSLLPALEEIRAEGDRTVRQTVKALSDMIRNRAKLSSPDPDVRRSAAGDLGSSGKVVA